MKLLPKPNSQPEACATHKDLLHIPELLEQIVGHLSPRMLLRVMRTCRHWREVIINSPASFLKAGPAATPVRMNPVLFTKTAKPNANAVNAYTVNLQPDILKRRDNYLQVTPSTTGMFVSQPPATEMVVTFSFEFTSLPSLSPGRSFRARETNVITTLRQDTGIRMAELLHAVERWLIPQPLQAYTVMWMTIGAKIDVSRTLDLHKAADHPGRGLGEDVEMEKGEEIAKEEWLYGDHIAKGYGDFEQRRKLKLVVHAA